MIGELLNWQEIDLRHLLVGFVHADPDNEVDSWGVTQSHLPTRVTALIATPGAQQPHCNAGDAVCACRDLLDLRIGAQCAPLQFRGRIFGNATDTVPRNGRPRERRA